MLFRKMFSGCLVYPLACGSAPLMTAIAIRSRTESDRAPQTLSYGIALWAMTLAPIAIIATLRETSVLFGAIIAILVLNEPLRAARSWRQRSLPTGWY